MFPFGHLCRRLRPLALLAIGVWSLAVRAEEDASVPAPSRTLIYGGDENFPPYEFIDASGQPAGLNIDLIRAMARNSGYRVEIRLLPWSQVRAGLKTQQIDVAAMYRSAQRAQEVEFAIPHELVYHEMYIRRNTPPLLRVSDLARKRILVQGGTFASDALAELGFAPQLVPVESEPEALRALARGEGDVAVVTQTAGRPFEDRATLQNAIVATGAPFLLSEYAFVTQHGRRAIVDLLNEGVVAAKANGQYERIYDRWLRPSQTAVRRMHLLLWILGGTGALLVWFVLWNTLLRRRVARQTEALRREFEERERSQAALAENERQLRQAQKLETVGRLAGGIAHDFNNILTVVLNYARFLRDDLVAAGRNTTEVDEILAAAERAALLTRQLLVFSRNTPVETAPHDLATVVRDLLGMIQRLVGEDVIIEPLLPASPVFAQIDRSSIEQALFNLAANARDAMQHHGRLTIAVDSPTLAAANPHQLPAGEYAAITVTDSGGGMSPSTLAHLGEPFFTTKELGKGTGLGLASVFATLAKHDGKVVVRSELRQGASFTLLLPRLPAPAAAAASSAAPAPALLGDGQTILLVEDDDALRRAMQVALIRRGYAVVEARDGEQALQLVAQGTPFDLLVTDVIMPRINGPELVARLRARPLPLLVLYVSGYVSTKVDLELGQPGTRFLPKPYTADQLAAAVRALLAGKPSPRRLPAR